MCSCGENHFDSDVEPLKVSRRDLFRQGATGVIGGGAAVLLSQAQLDAQQSQAGMPPAQAPAAVQPLIRQQGGVVFWGNGPGNADPASILAERQGPGKTTGLKFRALVRYANTLSTETLTLLPIHPLQVVIRMQASQTCYSSTNQLNTTNAAPFAAAAGHGGVGIIEEIGSLVKRVKVGDQVILATTPNCGVCGNCLSNRGDLCYMRLPAIPSATMSDRTPVYMTAAPMGPCGYSEFVVSDEDWVVPVFTKIPPVELSILACVGGTGLGLAMCRFPIEAGSDVAVFGLGPIGISAVQGARIQGAKTIIGIDPIRYRRELAMKLGATHVLDPNVDKGNDLINKIRSLTPDEVPTGRRYLGERAAGPMYVFEAVGGTRFPLPPNIESPSDMTGVEPLQQAWTVARSGGYVRTCSIGQPPGANVSFPAGQWANANKTHVPGNYAGVQALRDLPRFVRLIESSGYDAKAMVGQVFGSDRMKEAVQVAADRSAITSVINFD
jgi:S-(hydroxymethyl)glutathione dehydrogenase/alcohol dehydrogenase